MKYKLSDKIRAGTKVTLTQSYNKVPSGSNGKVIKWTYERFEKGVFVTRAIVSFGTITISVPTKILKKT